MEVLLLHPLQAERLSYLVQILHCMTRLLPSGILDRLCTRRWRPEICALCISETMGRGVT